MTDDPTEMFLETFFAPPNMAWPNADPESPVATALKPFLQALTYRGECPVILPRRNGDPPAPTSVYVVCWDIAHAGRVRALLEAAVAHNWCRFDGRVYHLNRSDPVDAAVLDLVGPGTTFVLRPSTHTVRQTVTALGRLVSTVGEAPLRETKAPRPIGRMLREFDLALASGAVESSAGILREIELFGGVSHENVAFLQIRRLAVLGKYEDLLAHGSLPSLVYAEPPRLVREAVLEAWARVNLGSPLPSEGVNDALAAIQAAVPDVAMLVDESLAGSSSAQVSTLCGLVAVRRGDHHLAQVLVGNTTIDPSVLDRLRAMSGIWRENTPDREEAERLPSQVPEETSSDSAVTSWLSWVQLLGEPDSAHLDVDEVLDWSPAWTVDAQLASAIDELPDLATDDLLAGVAAFIETDDFEKPASQTAAALLRRYLIAERFKPVDLGAMCALLGVFLRSAPGDEAYRNVLGDIRAFAPQWVAVATATRAIDLADAVVSGPVVNSAARSDFVASVLSPLNQQKRRLPPSLRQLAGMVTDDVALGFDWTIPEPVSAGTADRTGVAYRILLYSLDTGTLARVRKAVDLRWPDVRVSVSSERDGSPSLKQHARNSDLVVLATRRATHAATGFITDNSQGSLICYADGAGSASMFRAVENGLGQLAD